MKARILVVLLAAWCLQAQASRVAEINNSGVMMIGHDGKLYWAKQAQDPKPFFQLPGGVKAVALAINSKMMAFVLGEDQKIYQLVNDKEKKVTEFRLHLTLPEGCKALDLEISENNLMVIAEGGKLYLTEKGVLVEKLTIPGKGSEPEDPWDEGGNNGGNNGGDNGGDNGGGYDDDDKGDKDDFKPIDFFIEWQN